LRSEEDATAMMRLSGALRRAADALDIGSIENFDESEGEI